MWHRVGPRQSETKIWTAECGSLTLLALSRDFDLVLKKMPFTNPWPRQLEIVLFCELNLVSLA